MHNGCILNGDVGTGKTITALAYALLKEPGRDIYVITTAKKRNAMDWQNEAMKLGIHPDKIFVDSWNNIQHYHKVYGALFIFDEQRLVGTGAWVKTFYDIARKNRWVLLSATPGDTWLDYAPVFIANGFFKNITEFREKHVVYMPRVKFPKVKKYLDESTLMRYKWKIMVEMPMERHTKRHIETIECDYDKEMFTKLWKHRWNVFEDCPIQDAGELFRVGRKIVSSSTSRLEVVRELLRVHPKLVVFYNFDYELEMLRTLAEPSNLSDQIPTSSETRKATSAFGEKTEQRLFQHEPPSSTSGTLSVDEAFARLEGTNHGRRSDTWTSKESGLKGTIWEPGFDEENPNTWSDTPCLEASQAETSRSIEPNFQPSSGSKDSSSRNSTTSTATRADGSRSPQSMQSDGFAVAEWNGHKHEKIPNTDSWVYLVQYLAGAEGWNCTTTDTMVFYSLTYSYKQFYQSQGRIDRMNTPFTDLHYYVLTSKSIVDRAVWRALEQKKDFNVRGIRV